MNISYMTSSRSFMSGLKSGDPRMPGSSRYASEAICILHARNDGNMSGRRFSLEHQTGFYNWQPKLSQTTAYKLKLGIFVDEISPRWA